jgi:hypothetical protein
VTLSFAGSAGPGVVPNVVSTSSFTVAKSAASVAASPELAPMLVVEVMNGWSEKAVAIVVSSLITIDFDMVTVLHAPRADIRLMAALLVPDDPGVPPLATM